jgi:hypothetical protein
MKTKTKRLLVTFVLILAMVLLFTFIDFLFHAISEEYSVPSWYFRNKIIFETIYVCLAYWIFNKLNPALSSFLAAIITATLLQARYYFLGFNLEFVILFWGIHALILWPLLWLFFGYKDRLVNYMVKK